MDRHARRKKKRQQQQATAPSVTPDPPKTTPGRKTHLTPDVQKIIVDAAERGTPLTFCGPLAGVARSTLFNWMKWGAKPGTTYTAFVDAVKAAQAKFVADQVDGITSHGCDSWQARAWLLERMFRDEFGGDKLELNQLRKELRELRALVVQVPRETADADAERGGAAQGGGDRPEDRPAAETHP